MLRKILVFVTLALFLAALVFKGTSDKVVDADFEKSMGKGTLEYHHLISHKGSAERLAMLKAHYEKIKPSKAEKSDEVKIPKIIHQIWLGPKDPPGYFWEYSESWKNQHPDWEYRFWTNKEVEALDFDLKDLFDRTPNWGEKSDILRAELLDRYGGLYADTDFECVKSFEDLHYKYDFYAGVEPPHDGDVSSSSPHITISEALIGTTPGHPIIKNWKKKIRARWDEYERKYPDSPKRVLMRTFYPFGKAVVRKLHHDNRVNIIFPATYFYPLTFAEISKGRKKLGLVRRYLRKALIACNVKKPAPFSEIKPETMAVHYWGNSWVKSNSERFRDVHKQIVELQKDFKNEIATLQAEIRELKSAKSQ